MNYFFPKMNETEEAQKKGYEEFKDEGGSTPKQSVTETGKRLIQKARSSENSPRAAPT